jgi:hypothetical protein
VQEVRQPGGMVVGACRAKARRGPGAATLSRAAGLGTALRGGGAWGRCKDSSRWGRRQLGGAAQQEGRSIRGGTGGDLSARALGGGEHSGEGRRQQGREGRPRLAMQGRSHGLAGEIGSR